MKKRIYIYEMDCYKSASEERLRKCVSNQNGILIWKGCHLKDRWKVGRIYMGKRKNTCSIQLVQ